jgi:hypothetical protein
LINFDRDGVFDDDYEEFFHRLCQALSRQLKKRLIEQEIDTKEPAVAAQDTVELEVE